MKTYLILWVMVAPFFTALSAVEDIPEVHRRNLRSHIAAFLATPSKYVPDTEIPEGWHPTLLSPSRCFRAWCTDYAQTNGIAFSDIILLIQPAIEQEYDAFANNTPLGENEGYTRRDRLNAVIGVMRYLNDPVSLPFLYRMSRKAAGYYRKIFEDMFYETVEKSPVAAIREVLDTPEKMSQVDIDRLCAMID